MGVDVTLFVLAKYSSTSHAFVEHAFRLRRDRDLWEELGSALSSRSEWPLVQLPHGANSRCMEQHEPACGCDEFGWYTTDLYGGTLKSSKGSALKGLTSDYSDFNNAVLRFIEEHFAEHDVVAFWS